MMKYSETYGVDFDDVLIQPRSSKINSRSEVQLEIPDSYFQTEIVPVAAASVDGVGTLTMAKKLAEYKMPTFLCKNLIEDYSKIFGNEKVKGSEYFIPTFGIKRRELILMDQFLQKFGDQIRVVNIDVANGYTERYKQLVEMAIRTYPQISFIAGNVCTREGARTLFDVGANIVSVGIGNGAFCLTRIQTGIGNPQVSALLECREVAEEYNGEIICDGGCRSAGDVVKAFAAGAYMVKCAGLFSGYEESELFSKNENSALFYGMSSEEAMRKYDNTRDYRASEGRIVELKNKGPIDPQINNILGGLRSACTYTGCENVHQLYERTWMVKVHSQYNKMFEGK